MNAFRLLSQKLKSLPLIEILEEVIQKEDETIVMLIQRQLAEGRRGDGSKLPYYKASTKKIKAESGRYLVGDRISLIDTGDFWESMFAEVENGNLITDSRDWKTDMLVMRYGESILELAPDSLEFVVEKMFTQIQQKVYDHLNR